MNIKHEPVFGDQTLFNGAKDNHAVAIMDANGVKFFTEEGASKLAINAASSIIIAARMVIEVEDYESEQYKQDREKWVDKAFELELMTRYTDDIERIYDALLSGELPMPSKKRGTPN